MALISAAVSYGFGLHLREIIDPRDRGMTLRLTFLAPSVSVLANTLGKLSMVMFLVRLLCSSGKKVPLLFIVRRHPDHDKFQHLLYWHLHWAMYTRTKELKARGSGHNCN